jgi:hypothetical protein
MDQKIIKVTVPLRASNYTMFSGGDEATVWYAVTIVSGNLVKVTDWVFNNAIGITWGIWDDQVHRRKMQIVASDYFPGFTMNGNPAGGPYTGGGCPQHIILFIGFKRGGIQMDLATVEITAVIETETPQPVPQVVNLVNWSSPTGT